MDCYTEGVMHGSYAAAAATAGPYPMSVQNKPPEHQPKSEGFFGWLPGSGIMHKVIEKTKVVILPQYSSGYLSYLLTLCGLF